MKNLKKVLAMVLAFACTFTMFAGAKVFEDVPAGSDYSEAITMLSDLGIIQGKDDGKYHPEDTITRAEVTTIVNRMLGRSADKAFVDSHADTLTQFDDVSRTDWAYYQIMEATNAHDYKMSGGVEDWTRLQ